MSSGSKWKHVLLGHIPDEAVAMLWNVSIVRVRQAREEKDIPEPTRAWHELPYGKSPDYILAKAVGVPESAVRTMRRLYKIPAFRAKSKKSLRKLGNQKEFRAERLVMLLGLVVNSMYVITLKDIEKLCLRTHTHNILRADMTLLCDQRYVFGLRQHPASTKYTATLMGIRWFTEAYPAKSLWNISLNNRRPLYGDFVTDDITGTGLRHVASSIDSPDITPCSIWRHVVHPPRDPSLA